MRHLLIAFCGLSLACGEVKDQTDAAVVNIDSALTCGTGQMACSGQCVNTESDIAHCGSCSPCFLENATATCVQGVCEVAQCSMGFCDIDGTGGCEAQCARRAFILGAGVSANFGGLAAADALCQNDAVAAGLGGTWKAWLADTTGSPATRFTQGGAFVRVDRTTIIANDWADLIDGSLDAAVLTQANGMTPPIGSCWTNVGVGGTAAGGGTCGNWTTTSSAMSGTRGQHNLTDISWTSSGSQNCDPALVPAARLYCFEQ